jgi:hypothetical protein
MPPRFVAAFALVLCLAPLPSRAVEPSPAPAPTATPFSSSLPPSLKLPDQVKAAIDAAASLIRAEELRRKNVAVGEVTYFKRFEMQVRTSADHYRNVHLHQGTEIQPRGATPGPGRRVRVGGVAQPDGSLDADVITILSS